MTPASAAGAGLIRVSAQARVAPEELLPAALLLDAAALEEPLPASPDRSASGGQARLPELRNR